MSELVNNLVFHIFDADKSTDEDKWVEKLSKQEKLKF